MNNVATEVLIVLFLILANGLLAMAEIAIVSVRKARLQHAAERGDRRAALALDLANEPTLFLSTVQIGITLVGLLAGAYSGATLAEHLEVRLAGVAPLAAYSEPLSVGLVVLGLTYVSLVFGELVPKRIGLHDPEGIARLVVKPMRVLSVAGAPVVHLLSLSTALVLRLLRVQARADAGVTEDEIRVMLDQATESGVFEEEEQEMLERVMRLGDRTVNSLMTPRIDIVWIDVEDPPEVARAKIAEAPYSRFVVARGGLDEVLGIVHVKDLLGKAFACEPVDVSGLLRRVLFVPEGTKSLKLMAQFKESGTHFAVVIDEYGSVEGIVTFNDILEALVGNIPTLEDGGERAIVQREEGSWLMDGGVPIEEVEAALDVEELGGAERSFQTLGGFMLHQLGHIPAAAESICWEDFCFEVVDMDGQRIDKVMVTRRAEQTPNEEG